MKTLFYPALLALSLVLISIASPAAAISTAPVVSKNQTRSLDNLGPVTSQDTIDYTDTADI